MSTLELLSVLGRPMYEDVTSNNQLENRSRTFTFRLRHWKHPVFDFLWPFLGGMLLLRALKKSYGAMEANKSEQPNDIPWNQVGDAFWHICGGVRLPHCDRRRRLQSAWLTHIVETRLPKPTTFQ